MEPVSVEGVVRSRREREDRVEVGTPSPGVSPDGVRDEFVGPVRHGVGPAPEEAIDEGVPGPFQRRVVHSVQEVDLEPLGDQDRERSEDADVAVGCLLVHDKRVERTPWGKSGAKCFGCLQPLDELLSDEVVAEPLVGERGEVGGRLGTVVGVLAEEAFADEAGVDRLGPRSPGGEGGYDPDGDVPRQVRRHVTGHACGEARRCRSGGTGCGIEVELGGQRAGSVEGVDEEVHEGGHPIETAGDGGQAAALEPFAEELEEKGVGVLGREDGSCRRDDPVVREVMLGCFAFVARKASVVDASKVAVVPERLGHDQVEVVRSDADSEGEVGPRLDIFNDLREPGEPLLPRFAFVQGINEDEGTLPCSLSGCVERI